MTIQTPEEQARNVDELCAALRSGEYIQIPWALEGGTNRCCVLGLALRLSLGHDTMGTYGFSSRLVGKLVVLNNGSTFSGELSLMGKFGPDRLTFTELADWIKEQRDAYNGDLTSWSEER